ncbi:hypothetical protein [Winogradskyella costae]|uniref:hypothetical protein n=1 Tax=Winogradskyella costae TaxID=2697008 RepID=UPI0015CA61A6|nr:hypothetical protein [Winogradskyella costae]
MTQKNNQSNLLTIIYVGISCIFLGGFIGAVTNIINGAVSPTYFRNVMGWDFYEIWLASIAQGIFEGLIYGVIFSIIFTSAFSLITKNTGTYKFAFNQLLKIILLVILCWIIGGIIAILLATLSPDFYQSNFYNVPTDKTEMLKYAWVGGSIWGGMIGGILSAFFSVILLKNNWNGKASRIKPNG